VSAELILHNAEIATNGVIQGGGNSPEKCDIKKRLRGQSRALHFPRSAQEMNRRGLQ
jgi:hypothetical protein